VAASSTGGHGIARKHKAPQSAQPPEARRIVLLLTVAEAAFALLLAWLLIRPGFAEHASTSARVGTAGVLMVAPLIGSLAFFVFVLAFWQWRLSGRGRVRLLVAIHLSLVLSFCGLCWRDVSDATKRTYEAAGSSPRPLAATMRPADLAADIIGQDQGPDGARKKGLEGPRPPSVRQQIVEQTAAVMLTMASLLAGCVAVGAVVWLERNALKRPRQDDIVDSMAGS
jgi:hypothetical protein